MNTTISDAEAITRLSAIGLHLTRYSLITIIILGLFGNILNVLVFRQPKLRSNPCSFYLISAAYANLIWIIAGPFTRMISTFGLDLSERIAILCKIRHFIIYSLQSLSIMYVALATIDRFLISSMKVKYRRLSSLQNAHRLTIIISIVYCLIFVNMFYCLNVTGTSPLLACTTTTSSICGLFNEIARLVLLAFIPTLLILIFGIGTIQNIKKSRKNIIPQQNAHHNIRRKDRQLVQVRTHLPKSFFILFLFLNRWSLAR
jgi:hypothetical protein